jgi:uncharacterized membrane protein
MGGGVIQKSRLTARASALSAALLCPIAATAQTVPSTAEQAVRPSVGHAMMKGITLKAATTGVAAAIYYVGTGSLLDMGTLTALSTAGTYAIYVANEYLWDAFSPDTGVSGNRQTFDAPASLWRNTWKYLTFKPTVAAFNWGLVYAYTGSVSAMITLGSAGTIAIPLVYYANNVAWDWYDWHTAASGLPTGAPRLQ